MPEKLNRRPILLAREQHKEQEMVSQPSAPVPPQQQQPGKRKGSSGGRSSQVSFILEGLYLSGARAVRQSILKELGISLVVNGTAELPVVPFDGAQVLRVEVSDSPTSELYPHLHGVSDRISEELCKGGRVLVHCVAGVSRSPALVMAYLVKYEGMDLRQAFQRVRLARPGARPNASFFRQLIDFERDLRGSTSVSLLRDPELGLTVPDVCEEEVKMLWDVRWAKMIHERRNFERLYA